MGYSLPSQSTLRSRIFVAPVLARISVIRASSWTVSIVGEPTLLSTLPPPVFNEPVAYSKTLKWFRDRTPVEKDISPNERQLNHTDIAQIAARFDVVSVRYFHLFTRLARLFPSSGRTESKGSFFLQWLDSWLLKIPFVDHFAGIVVVLCRKRG